MIAALQSELEALDQEPLAGKDGRSPAARRTAAFDRAVIALFGPFARSGVSLAAIGGYGRREMTPGSDLDLLFLYGSGMRDAVRAATDAVLYPLWDAGLRASQAVRTVEECRAQAAGNLQSLTSLMDARALGGTESAVGAAAREARVAAAADLRGFVDALQASRVERERTYGSAGERLEPNLKEGIGGLRDVQVLRWLDMATGALPTVADPVGRKIRGRLRATAEAVAGGEGAVLLLTRTALHRVAMPASDVLVAEVQASVAEALGLAAEEGWEARDVLMREVSTGARFVAGACDEFAGNPRYWVDVTTEEASRWPPHKEGGPGSSAMTSTFGEVLRGEASGRTLRLMDGVRFLERLIPEWTDVRGRPQRDPYHRFPVDTHLIEAASAARRLLDAPEEPFAVEAVAQLDEEGRDALLLGALLHDIGKVGRGSHVALGSEIAARVLDRMGIEGSLREDSLFLVREHLLISDTATRRNVGDEDVVLRVAARVGDPRRLALLYLLTVADAVATGPAASTPWRMGLIRELVARVEAVFERGLMDPGRATGLERAEAAVRAAATHLPRLRVDQFLEVIPSTYLMTAAPGDAPSHVGLIVPPPRRGEIRTHVAAGRVPGTYLLSVAAADRLGVLAHIAGALTVSGLTIISAQAFTTETGTALDLFDVRGAFETEVSDERWERFRSLLEKAQGGELDLVQRVRSLRSQYRPPASGIPVAVRVSGGMSDFFTVVEVEAADRLGLLFDLCRAFADLGMDVHSARAATYGPRVVDVFDVTDDGGVKVTDEGRVVALERALRAAAGTDS